MGYDTGFEGAFILNAPLTTAHNAYLKAFSETRHVKRDANELKTHADPLRLAVGLPLGEDGAYFVGDPSRIDQIASVDQNTPPTGQPGLWCQWEPTDDGKRLQWDGGERFYQYVEWLQYVIEHFFIPWGYVLAGRVSWQGDYEQDRGIIEVVDNDIQVSTAICVLDEFQMPRPLRVFLCHASEDKPRVRRLCRRLTRDGVSTWLDEDRLLPGQDWRYEIAKAIRQVDAVLVCLSSHSVNKVGFVQREIRIALDIADEQPEGSIYIIPVKFETCPIPIRLSQWQWVEMTGRHGYGRLLSALEARAEEINDSRHST